MADPQNPAPVDEIDPGRQAADSQSALAGKQPSTTTGRALLAASNAAAARGTLGLATSDAPQFAGLEVGHASDTTITRVSSGVIAVEGVQVAMGTGTATGTNTGDQTITLTGDVTGTGTGSFAATLSTTQPSAHAWSATQTFTLAPVFTDQSGSRTALGLGSIATQSAASVAITGGSVTGLSNTGFSIFDVGDEWKLSIVPGSTLTNNRTLTIATGDSDRTLTLSGNTTLGGGSHSGTNTGDQTTITGNAGTATSLQTGRTIAMTGDVTWTSPSFDGSGNVKAAGTIANGAVSLAKMANLAQDQFIGRTTASTGVPETATITAAARTVLDDTTVAAMRNTLGLGTSWDLIHRTTPPVWCTDFMHNNPVQKDFTGGAINSGTIASGVAASIVANHPGVMQLSSSSTPNSGYQFIIRGASILLSGSEQMDVVLYTPASINASTTIRLGFGDTITSADNTDGVYFEIVNTTATGRTASNSSRSSTGTTYTLSASTWYHFRVSLNSDATTATFKIFDDSGTELFSDTLSTNIPTASGRELGGGIVATNSGSSAVALANIDYICVSLGRTLARGALT